MDELEDLFPEKGPVCEVSPDGVRVVMQDRGLGGEIAWAFNAIEVKRKDFDCQLEISITSSLPGYEDIFPATHFSGESASARDTFRRTLDGFFGKELPWAKLLTKAYALAREAYLSAAQTVDLQDVDLAWEEAWHVEGLWPSDGVTILFGQGSHGKGHITTSLVLRVCMGVEFLGHPPGGGSKNVLYLDYEGNAKVIARRLNRHILGGPSEDMPGVFSYMPGRAIAVADQIDAIRRELARTKAGALIVDSAIPALGGDPLRAEIVGRMFNALNTLGVPVWMLAHVTKGGEEEFPFGSVFWHNLARMTWFIKKVDDEESPDIQVAVFNKKINEGRLQRSWGAEIKFDDPTGPITVSPYDFARDTELSKGMKLPARIWGALTQPKPTSQLAEELGATPNIIRATASRMKGRIRGVALPGDKETWWSRISYLKEPDEG